MASRYSLRRAAVLLVIGLAGSLGAATPAVAEQTGAGPSHRPTLVDPAPCAEVANFTCAYLSVPLDHSGVTPGRLRLRVAVADNAAAPRGVLMLLTGGPGQPGAGLAGRVVPRLAPLLNDYRLVLLDRPTMPVLLLAGDRDLSTPLEWARAEATHALQATLVVIPGMGHSIQGRNATGDAAVQEVLLGRP